jgi:hypothetical protein
MARNEKKSPPALPEPPRRTHRAARGGSSVSTAAAAVGRAVVEDTAENSLAASQNVTAWLAQWRQLNDQAMSFWSEALRGMGEQLPLAWNWGPWVFLPADLAQRQLSDFLAFLGGTATHQAEEAPTAAAHRFGAATTTPRLWQRGDEKNNGGAAPPDPMARAQAEWLALTQGWLQGMAPARDGGAEPGASR